MLKTDLLLDSSPFFKPNQDLFWESLAEATCWHFDNNDYIHYLFKRKGIDPQTFDFRKDIELLPFVMVNIFKHYELKSVPDEKIVLTLGSSGTSGQRSQIFLDQTSLSRVKKMAFNIHAELGLCSEQAYNYLCFTYDPRQANDLGTAFTDELLTSFTGKNEVYYTFQMKDGTFQYNENETIAKLHEFQNSTLPTRILGFPAFLYELISKHRLKLELGVDSWVQTGGGWKSKAGQQVGKKTFRELVSTSFGIPTTNIRDMFGMVEHGVPYVDDKSGRLRIPNYARVLIRDPQTLKVMKPNETGLIQFISSYLTSFPSSSLLTTDWGSVHYDEFGAYLEIKGRAGTTKNKGCALKALEMMG